MEQSEKLTSVKEATLDDLKEILRLIELFHDEAIKEITFSRPYVLAYVVKLIQSPFAVILLSKGGLIAGTIDSSMFNGKLYACEKMWYVDKEHRGSTGIRLLKAFEKWAKKMKVTAIEMAALGMDIDKLYRRMGYKKLETHYLKEV